MRKFRFLSLLILLLAVTAGVAYAGFYAWDPQVGSTNYWYSVVTDQDGVTLNTERKGKVEWKVDDRKVKVKVEIDLNGIASGPTDALCAAVITDGPGGTILAQSDYQPCDGKVKAEFKLKQKD